MSYFHLVGLLVTCPITLLFNNSLTIITKGFQNDDHPLVFPRYFNLKGIHVLFPMIFKILAAWGPFMIYKHAFLTDELNKKYKYFVYDFNYEVQ